MIENPLELPFDQYQRYRLVADLLADLRDGSQPLSILDVGGRTANLRAFLPEDRVHLVDVDPSDEPGLVLGDGARLPFQDRAFDVVAAFDTLEHVPPRSRAAFVAECARVARRWVVLAGPYQSDAVERSEQLLQRFLRDKLGIEHRYLEEHRHNGLPDLAAARTVLEKAGARTAAIGHGNLERWLPMMCLSLYLDDEPDLRDLAKAIFRFYNAELYRSDHAEPVYRHALVGALAGAPLPAAPAALELPRAPAGVLERFDDVIGELACFDRARAKWSVERERLWEVTRTFEQDLAGHRETLASERRLRSEAIEESRTLAVDLAGHRTSLDDLRATLAIAQADLARAQSAAQAMRAELESELAVLRTASTAAERARDEERASRARLENEVDRMAAEVAAVRADLEGHRDALREERARRAEADEVTRTLEADLAGHRDALAAGRAELAATREELVRAQAGIETTRVELAGEIATLRTALGASERSRDEERGLRHRLEQEVDAAKASLDTLRAQAAATDSDLSQHRAVLRELTGELERHKVALNDLRGEAERLRVELASALHERNVEQQRLEGAHGELARVAQILQEQDRTITALRAEQRDRLKSLRRAFGPKKPTP